MMLVISQETFVPLKGGWAILWPRVALGMLDRPSKSENGDCPCPPKRRFLPKRVQSQSPQSPSPSPRPLVAGGPHLQTPQGGWAILWPRVALGMLDRPSKSENGDCPCPPKRRFLPKRVQSQSPQSPSPSPRPLVAGGPHLQTPHRRDKSSCEHFDTTNHANPHVN